jgi:hypothetical protein
LFPIDASGNDGRLGGSGRTRDGLPEAKPLDESASEMEQAREYGREKESSVGYSKR